MKRCNIKNIDERCRNLFVADKNGYVPMPGDLMQDFNFDWGHLQNNKNDSKQERVDKKNKRKKAFELACVSNVNLAHVRYNINIEEWKNKDGE